VCGLPTELMIPFGSLNPTLSMYMPGDVLVYTCLDGYDTRDIIETVCTEGSFTWSLDANPPLCIRGKCIFYKTFI